MKQHSWFFYWCSAINPLSLPWWGKKKKKETGLVYKVAFCHLREVNFIRSTARCASHVTQSSSLLMKCCIQNSACGAQGDKTVVTEWNKPLPIHFPHVYKHTHKHTSVGPHTNTHTHSLTLASEHPCEEIQICNLFKYWYFYLSGERCLEISSEYCCQRNSRKYVR